MFYSPVLALDDLVASMAGTGAMLFGIALYLHHLDLKRLFRQQEAIRSRLDHLTQGREDEMQFKAASPKNAVGKKYKSAINGKYVTKEYADKNPISTYAEGTRPSELAEFIDDLCNSSLSQDAMGFLLDDLKRSDSKFKGKQTLIERLQYQYDRSMD